MEPRVLLQMVLAILLASLFAGCTAAPGAGDGAPGGDGAGAPEDEAGHGPFFGLDPGVVVMPLPAGQSGGIEGQVYDLENGSAIRDATVTATCLRQSLPGEETTETRALPVNGAGFFAMTATGAFADCLTITYTIEAPGYTIQVPLESGPLLPEVQYLINGGMVPDP